MMASLKLPITHRVKTGPLYLISLATSAKVSFLDMGDGPAASKEFAWLEVLGL